MQPAAAARPCRATAPLCLHTCATPPVAYGLPPPPAPLPAARRNDLGAGSSSQAEAEDVAPRELVEAPCLAPYDPARAPGPHSLTVDQLLFGADAPAAPPATVPHSQFVAWGLGLPFTFAAAVRG